MKSQKTKTWRVRQDFPKGMEGLMDFVDPFIAKTKEAAAFIALNLIHFSLYRDKEMKKGKTALDVLTELEFAVVEV